MQPFPADATLIVIDVQRAFDDPAWGHRNNPEAEQNIAAILEAWRVNCRPVVHIQHRNAVAGRRFSPDQPGFAVKPEAQPVTGEPVLYKTVNSAFIGTDLEDRLRAAGATAVVVVGITTDHCVSTTVRMAANLGFDTTIVHDATCTFDRVGPDGRHWSASDMHASALVSLNNEFATVASTEDVIRAAVLPREGAPAV